MTDELKRDLQLASHTRDIQISPDEVAPKAKQELSLKTKKAPEGPKVIRTEHPTVKASATPVQVAEIKADIPQVQVMASAPAPSQTPSDDAPPLARPAAIPAQGYPGAAAIPASNNGSVLGGIFGAIIRGGAVGDDDHCDPRGGRPRAGRPVGGDVYMPRNGGMIGVGGIGPTPTSGAAANSSCAKRATPARDSTVGCSNTSRKLMIRPACRAREAQAPPTLCGAPISCGARG
jgi:hypothetical protein